MVPNVHAETKRHGRNRKAFVAEALCAGRVAGDRGRGRGCCGGLTSLRGVGRAAQEAALVWL
jgi:hypothetical protein